jgi:hypothetical protein
MQADKNMSFIKVRRQVNNVVASTYKCASFSKG